MPSPPRDCKANVRLVVTVANARYGKAAGELGIKKACVVADLQVGSSEAMQAPGLSPANLPEFFSPSQETGEVRSPCNLLCIGQPSNSRA